MEFYQWWVLKNKILGQKSTTSKEINLKWILNVKNHTNRSDFFSVKNNILGVCTFFVKIICHKSSECFWFFFFSIKEHILCQIYLSITLIFLTLYFLKSWPFFYEMSKIFEIENSICKSDYVTFSRTVIHYNQKLQSFNFDLLIFVQKSCFIWPTIK